MSPPGSRKRWRTPCVPSGIAETLEDALAAAAEIGYPVIVRPAYTLGGSGGGIAADEEEMRVFMLVTSVDDDKLQYLDVDSVNYKEGQRVRVLDGPYKDCVGYIKRIKGNRRLLVAVEGLALVATSYIPSVFLEKIN